MSSPPIAAPQHNPWMRIAAVTCRLCNFLEVVSTAAIVPAALLWTWQLHRSHFNKTVRVLVLTSVVALTARVIAATRFPVQSGAPDFLKNPRLTYVLAVLLSPLNWPCVMLPHWHRARLHQQRREVAEQQAADGSEVDSSASNLPWAITLRLLHGLQTRSRAARESLQRATREAAITAAFEAASAGFRDEAYIPLFIDCVTTVLPLTVIALVTYGGGAAGRVSSLGWVVVALGLVATAMRLPVLLATCDVKLQLVRTACVLHDWASTAYVLATLGALWQQGGAATLWSRSPMIVRAWFIKTAAIHGCLIGMAGYLTWDSIRSSGEKLGKLIENSKVWAIGVAVSPGVAILIEQCRLGFFAGALIGNGAQRDSAAYRLLSDFLLEGPRVQRKDYFDPRPGSRMASVVKWLHPMGDLWQGYKSPNALFFYFGAAQSISAVFPFVHSWNHWEHHSTLQRAALVAAAVTAAPILMLSRYTWKRWRMTRVFYYVGNPPFSTDEVLEVIQRHLQLTDLRVLLSSIDAKVLPTDVVQVVLTDFMDPQDIDIRDWSVAEIDAVRSADVEL